MPIPNSVSAFEKTTFKLVKTTPPIKLFSAVFFMRAHKVRSLQARMTNGTPHGAPERELLRGTWLQLMRPKRRSLLSQLRRGKASHFID